MSILSHLWSIFPGSPLIPDVSSMIHYTTDAIINVTNNPRAVNPNREVIPYITLNSIIIQQNILCRTSYFLYRAIFNHSLSEGEILELYVPGYLLGKICEVPVLWWICVSWFKIKIIKTWHVIHQNFIWFSPIIGLDNLFRSPMVRFQELCQSAWIWNVITSA